GGGGGGRGPGWVHPSGEERAGREIPTRGAQPRGPRSARLAGLPHAGGWAAGGLPAAAERYRHDLLAVPRQAPAGGPLAAATGLSLARRRVQPTSLRRRDDWLGGRLVAHPSTPPQATLTPPTPPRPPAPPPGPPAPHHPRPPPPPAHPLGARRPPPQALNTACSWMPADGRTRRNHGPPGCSAMNSSIASQCRNSSLRYSQVLMS